MDPKRNVKTKKLKTNSLEATDICFKDHENEHFNKDSNISKEGDRTNRVSSSVINNQV